MATRPPRKIHQTLTPPPRNLTDENSFGVETAREMEFLVSLLNLSPDDAVLDVASGAGRHALELGRRGFTQVTAVDLSDQLLGIGTRTAEATGLPVEFVKADPRSLRLGRSFDAALILGGGAFGLMESDHDNQQILDAVFSVLKPGGRVALSAMSLIWLVRTAKDLSGYDPLTGYLTTTESVQIEGGVVEKLPLHERYYAFPGLKRRMEQAGFRNILGFGAAPGRYSSRSISVEDPELLVSGTKPKS